MVRTTKAAADARAAAAAGGAKKADATPATGSGAFDFPFTGSDDDEQQKQPALPRAGEPLNVDDIFGEDDEKSASEDDVPEKKRATRGKRKQNEPADKKTPPFHFEIDVDADDEEAMLLNLFSSMKKSRSEEKRKKAAEIVSDAREKLKDLQRALETAKASTSSASSVQQKRMEEWKAELQKLEAGVDKTIAQFKADIAPQSAAIHALREKIASLADVTAWTTAADGASREFTDKIKNLEKQAAGVVAAAEKKVDGLKKDKGKGGALAQRLMEVIQGMDD